VKTAKASH
jgi:hypothetical protein